MMKKLVAITLTLFLGISQLTLAKNLLDAFWIGVAKAAIKDGDSDDKGEFKFARQAYLNIKEDFDAEDIAEKIATKWPKYADEAKLKAEIRYPQIEESPNKKKELTKAAEDLFKEPEIKTFMKEVELKVTDKAGHDLTA